MTTRNRKKARQTVPNVAIILESSHEVSRAMIRGIFKFIRIYGDWRISISSGGPSEQKLPDSQFWQGEGAIVRIPNAQVAEELVASRLPCVLIDPPDEYLISGHPLALSPSVRCDSAAVGRMAAEYLMNLGFDHYGYVGRADRINWSQIRGEYFKKTLADACFTCQEYPLDGILPDQTPHEEMSFMTRWLQQCPKPMAIFAANDHRARLVLDACVMAQIPVPYQVAVLGVNNDELICETTFPPLSSIALNAEEGGYAAAHMLHDIFSRNDEDHPAAVTTFGPKEVVERVSTCHTGLSNPRLIKAIEYIRLNAGLNLNVNDVARHVGLTRQWLEKLFRTERHCSVHDEITRVRFRTIRSLVAQTKMTFTAIASYCGFENDNHLRALFKKEFGMTMSQYRLCHENESESEHTNVRDIF